MPEIYRKTVDRSYYEDSIEHFVLDGDPKGIVAFLTESSEENDEALPLQKGAWSNQIKILKSALKGKKGYIIFEYIISRLNRRIDVVLLMDGIVYSLEFKNNEFEFLPDDIDQADGYGYALKNFHAASKDRYVAPLLIATRAPDSACSKDSDLGIDGLFSLFKANPAKMMDYINAVSAKYGGKREFTEEDFKAWITSPFKANPTIIDSARAIYSNNKVQELWMFDAGEENLSVTEDTVREIVKEAKENKKKVICFVTGVPGAGKTLVGLDIAGKSRHEAEDDETKAIFFSGNGPLINVLTAQLGRDAYEQHPEHFPNQNRATMDVKSFIQDLHAFKRDIVSSSDPTPDENVLIFDEAQRVWDADKLTDWLIKKKERNFSKRHLSEADLLLDVLKKKEWALIIALVGLGQDIHVGENGLRTWFESLLSKNTDWDIRLSNEIFEQNADQLGDLRNTILASPRVKTLKGLHLKTALRTPRAKNMSAFSEALLENRPLDAKKAMASFQDYPIYVTRDLNLAKRWVQDNRKRKERCGALYSSNGKNIKTIFKQLSNFFVPKWFLETGGPDSSNSLIYAASEFDVQGLEIDWALLNWDMDMYYTDGNWHQQRMLSGHYFKESDEIQKKHILNSYRVLLTRARKGVVIYVPRKNDFDDRYGVNAYYDSTYEYLKSCGIKDLLDDKARSTYTRKAIELPF